MLHTPWFCFAVLKPLVEMTTIHYKPFENSPHKCHPLSAVSTPRTQGIFKKPNLQLSEILLNSYLFAAGSFCAIPLLCIGAEINHRPCTPHQYDFSLWVQREDSQNSIDNRINKRGKIWKNQWRHPGHDPCRHITWKLGPAGEVCGCRPGSPLRDLEDCLTCIFIIIKEDNYHTHSCKVHTDMSGACRCDVSACLCARSGPRTAPACWVVCAWVFRTLDSGSGLCRPAQCVT